ncbi:plastocyanin/azurin family copper-binding protein [Akkermansiaceae bacterium]|nr:plastocyanin/azurin family copper-binding protein [Akkermansiaceae bacterium]
MKEFDLKAGKKVKLIFVNPDFMPHNFVIVKPGTADAVGNAAIALGAEGFKKGWLPESGDILHSTKLLEKGETEELEFTAPTEPGDYQFVCTFPGHAVLMRGVIHVK